MIPYHVLIDNWPEQNWILTWIPILISFFAFITSILSIYYTAISFKRSTRPFIWTLNYSYEKDGKLIPQDEAFLIKLANSPALIKMLSINIEYYSSTKTTVIFKITEENFPRYPEEYSKWWFSQKADEFKKAIENIPENSLLIREIDIIYKSIAGGKSYRYFMKQEYRLTEKKWIDIVCIGD